MRATLPALALCLVASACGGATCPTQRIVDPAKALAAQRASAPPIRSLRAEAKIDQRGPEGRIKGRILMFVERPDRVRFDAMTQFGPALILTSDGTTFALTDFKDNRFSSGPACARNIQRVVGVALSSAEVASVLLGDPPLVDAQAESLTCNADGQYLVSQRAENGGRAELSLRVNEADRDAAPDAQRLTLAAATLFDAHGKKLLRVRYEDYAKVGATQLPHTVRIEDFSTGSDAVLRLSDAAVDVKVPEGAFAQTPRPGLKIEEVRCEP